MCLSVHGRNSEGCGTVHSLSGKAGGQREKYNGLKMLHGLMNTHTQAHLPQQRSQLRQKQPSVSGW